MGSNSDVNDKSNERKAAMKRASATARRGLHIATLQDEYYSGRGCAIFLNLDDDLLRQLNQHACNDQLKEELCPPSVKKHCRIVLNQPFSSTDDSQSCKPCPEEQCFIFDNKVTNVVDSKPDTSPRGDERVDSNSQLLQCESVGAQVGPRGLALSNVKLAEIASTFVGQSNPLDPSLRPSGDDCLKVTGKSDSSPVVTLDNGVISHNVREQIALNKATAIAKRGAKERTARNKAAAVAKRLVRARKPL